MESPRKHLIVPKDNQAAGRSTNIGTPKRQRSPSLKGNCEGGREMGRNLTVEHPKTSPAAATKHFMAPTISAVSKASPGRKKILCERNEAAETRLVKTPLSRSRSVSRDRFGKNENTDSLVDGISVKGGRASMDSSTPRPNFLLFNSERRKEMALRRDNEVQDCKKDDGYSPLESGYASDDIRYDPVRNYLSPRPKFLWYDPNRGRVRTLRRGSETKEPSDSDNMTVSECDLGSSSSSLDYQEAEKERDEVNQSDGEMKEVDKSDRKVKEVEEEEMDVTNYLIADAENAGDVDLVDSASAAKEETDGGEVDLADSVSVVCQENGVDEVNEDVEEGDWELEEAEMKKGCHLRGVLKFVLLLFVLAISTSVIVNMNSYPPASLGLEGNVESGGDQITLAEKDHMPLNRLSNLEVFATTFTEAAGGQDTETEEMRSEGNDILDAVEDENLSIATVLLSKEVEQHVEEEESGELGGLLEVWNGDSLYPGHISALELHETEGVGSRQHLPRAYAYSADADVKLAGATSGLESENDIFENNAEAFAAEEETSEFPAVEFQEIELPTPTYELAELIKEEIVDREVVEMIENTPDVNNNPEIPDRVAEMEVLELPFKIDIAAGHEMHLEGAGDHMESENANLDELVEEEMVDTELGRIRSTIIGGISALSFAVASLFWALRAKSKRTSGKETLQVVEPSVENKPNLDHSVPTLAATKTPFDLIEKYSRAPSVELLSEFAWGEMSSLRKSGMKSRIVVTEEVSSHSAPLGKAKAYSVPAQIQPAISAISSTENRSMTNWEESGEVESSRKKKFTTPARRTSLFSCEDEGSEVLSMNTAETPTTLRRSSRLRSRGITSP